jgi:hypothetical protein
MAVLPQRCPTLQRKMRLRPQPPSLAWMRTRKHLRCLL